MRPVMKISTLAALAAFAGLAICHTNAANAASFDCLMASSPAEVTICEHPRLSDLDTVLSAAFNQVIRQNPYMEHDIRMYAQSKLNQRNSCRFDVQCIIDVQLDSINFYKRHGATVSFPSWTE